MTIFFSLDEKLAQSVMNKIDGSWPSKNFMNDIIKGIIMKCVPSVYDSRRQTLNSECKLRGVCIDVSFKAVKNTHVSSPTPMHVKSMTPCWGPIGEQTHVKMKVIKKALNFV